MPDGRVVVNSRSYDWSVRRSWHCELIETKGTLLSFFGEFDRDIQHPFLGLIEKGTTSYEYYWLDRWYSIFRFHRPTGEFHCFYCNINTPPTFADGVLDLIDLDIDVVVFPDWSYAVLDEEEFEENAQTLSYPEETIEMTQAAKAELLEMIAERKFPFDTVEMIPGRI